MNLMWLILILLFLGGLGIGQEILAVLAVAFLALWLLADRRIKFPPHFWLYAISVGVMALPLFWSADVLKTLETLMFFISGSFFWLLTYNNREFLRKKFLLLFLIPGALFLIIYLLKTLWPNWFNPDWRTLVEPVTTGNHHRLGDYWSVVVVGLSTVNPLLIFVGLPILVMSLSRSAYLAVFSGLTFLWFRKRLSNRWFFTLLVLPVVLIAYAGFGKSLFLSRPYYFQAIVSVINYPMGIGLGNFSLVSNLNNFSASAHNLVLEALVGAGIFVAPFIYWLIKAAKSVLSVKSQVNPASAAMWIAITVNFMFDANYHILTMWWSWFLLLGLIETD